MARPSTKTLTITTIPSKDSLKIFNPFKFKFNEEEYVIEPGFTWKGESIPASLWKIIEMSPFHPRVLRATMIHDFLAQESKYKEDRQYRQLVGKYFSEILLEDGIPPAEAGIMEEAVVTYGDLWR